jgi:hypothetical protein
MVRHSRTWIQHEFMNTILSGCDIAGSDKSLMNPKRPFRKSPRLWICSSWHIADQFRTRRLKLMYLQTFLQKFLAPKLSLLDNVPKLRQISNLEIWAKRFRDQERPNYRAFWKNGEHG